MSDWTEHVKAYAKKNGVSYKEAMSKASATYKKKGSKAREKVSGEPSKGMARKGEPKGSRLAYDDTDKKKKREKK